VFVEACCFGEISEPISGEKKSYSPVDRGVEIFSNIKSTLDSKIPFLALLLSI
jgi:hypothetical protein